MIEERERREREEREKREGEEREKSEEYDGESAALDVSVECSGN
jgi:hypothetical protein